MGGAIAEQWGFAQLPRVRHPAAASAITTPTQYMTHIDESTWSQFPLACLAAWLLSIGGVSAGVGLDSSAPSTTIQGQVLGVASPSEVCAYTVTPHGRGGALTHCVPTETQGYFSIEVPVRRGAVLLEAATGPAVVQALVDARGGTTTADLTPQGTQAVQRAWSQAGHP